MKSIILSWFLTFNMVAPSLTWANVDELDGPATNEASEASLKSNRLRLSQTVISRVDTRTGDMAMVQTDQKLDTVADAEGFLSKDPAFTPIDRKNIVSENELDQERGTSSWFWFLPFVAFGVGAAWANHYNHYTYYSYGQPYNPWYNRCYGYYCYCWY